MFHRWLFRRSVFQRIRVSGPFSRQPPASVRLHIHGIT
ncbi:hypothetical protein SNL152K_4769 [Streptomyces sp. NL15-2K]|nr:hypothetical protein SNL152K_4769 [Streptomyces sp. NL15-2K]